MYTIDKLRISRLAEEVIDQIGLKCCKKWSVYNNSAVQIEARFDCKTHGRHQLAIDLVADDHDKSDERITRELNDYLARFI